MSQSASTQNSSARAPPEYKNCECHDWSSYTPAQTINVDVLDDTDNVFTDTVSDYYEDGVWRERKTTLKQEWHDVSFAKLVDRVLSGDALLTTIAKGINAHAERTGDSFRLSDDSLKADWQIRLYIMILVAMRLYNCSVVDFWDMDTTKGHRSIAKYMSRPEWEAINRNFVLNPAENPDYIDLPHDDPNFHPYAEWTIGLEVMKENLRATYEPGNIKTMDESRVAGKAKGHPFTNRIPDKPQRCGLDIFTTATFGKERVGIISDLTPYCGERTWEFDDDDSDDEVPDGNGQMDNLVYHILKENCEPGDIFCCDKRFTSVWAFERATDLGIGAIGVIDPVRRHLPREEFRSNDFKQFKAAKVRGSMRQFVDESPLHLTALWDSGKSPLYLLDNCLNPDVRMEIARQHGKKSKSAPSGTVELFDHAPPMTVYNKCMGAVDAANRSRSLLFIDRISRRKYTRTFQACIEFLAFVSTADLHADTHNVCVCTE